MATKKTPIQRITVSENVISQRDLETPQPPQWVTSEGQSLEELESTTSIEEALEEEQTSWMQFDERFHEPFEGLTYIGDLKTTFSYLGHSFLVKTLTSGEKIEIIRICKELEGSLGYAKLFRAATAAAGLIAVDGQPIIAAQKNVGFIQQKLEYIVNMWYDPIIDMIFEHINDLETSVLTIITELGTNQNERFATRIDRAIPTSA